MFSGPDLLLQCRVAQHIIHCIGLILHQEIHECCVVCIYICKTTETSLCHSHALVMLHQAVHSATQHTLT